MRLASAVAASEVGMPLPDRMCFACLAILGVDGGSFTLGSSEPHRMTLCATDDSAKALDDLQEVTGEGPSFTAFEERTIVVMQVDGDNPEDRWPLFSSAAKQRFDGYTIYAVPMKPGPQTMGVATFHQRRPAPLLVDEQTSQLLINSVAVALIKDPELLEHDHLTEADSWGNRARIHQATGMVMAQLALAPDDAMALLRGHAYAMGRSLSDISEQVTDRRLDFRAVDVDPEGGRS